MAFFANNNVSQGSVATYATLTDLQILCCEFCTECVWRQGSAQKGGKEKIGNRGRKGEGKDVEGIGK